MVSLYLKYRPLQFDDIVDQEMPKRALRNAVASSKTSHAYLFCGPRGTGKTSMARILAKALVCREVTAEGNPCGTCPTCTAVQEGTLVDIIEIDAASNRGIDEIRALKERIHFAPTQALKKVYIIDEVHMLTKDAFNALLKTLEEPPSHVHFILATTEVHKVLDTILSRCQRYDFRRITDKAITDRLVYIAEQEGLSFSREALDLIARAANGGLRDAIRTLEQLSHTMMYNVEDVQQFLGHAGMSRTEEMIDLLMARELSQALHLLDTLYQNGVHMRELCKELLFGVRSRMMGDIEKNEMKHIEVYLRLLTILDEAKDQLRGTMIEQLPMEVAYIRFCQSLQVSAPVKDELVLKEIQKQSKETSFSSPSVQVESKAKSKVSIQKESVPVSPAPVVTSSTTLDAFDDFFSTSTQVDSQKSSKEESNSSLSEETEMKSAAENSEESLDLAHIQQEWKKFCNSIQKSSVKFCLREGRPMAYERGRLQVLFSTKFSLDKVMEPVNKEEVYRAFKSFYGVSVELMGEVHSSSPIEKEESSSHSPSSPSSSDDVFSVFGGSTLL